MGVYVRDRSPFFWLYIATPDGRKVRESTNIRHDAPTVALRKDNRQQAEIRFHQRYAEVIGAAHSGTRPRIAFSEWADWYRDHISVHKKGKDIEAINLAHLSKFFGALPLHRLDKTRVQEYAAARSATVKASTVNREIDLLKHVLNSAVPKYLDKSPIAGMRRLRQVQVEIQTLSKADETKLLKVLAPADRVVVIAAIDTLARASELLRLEWRHDHGSHIVIVESKIGEGRKVPVSKRLRVALDGLKRRRKKPTGPIFKHRRKGKDPTTWTNSLKQMLESACERAGVTYGREASGITFHGLRHTGASRMVNAGVPLRAVQEIGGWKNLRQLVRYSHPSEDVLKKAVEAAAGV